MRYLCLLTAALCVGAPEAALAAQPYVGLETSLLAGAKAGGEASSDLDLDLGAGGAVRFGVGAPIGYYGLGIAEGRVGASRLTLEGKTPIEILDARVGGRALFGRAVRVGGYAHVGLSFVDHSIEGPVAEASDDLGVLDLEVDGRWGADAGLLMDIPLTSFLSLGAHVGANLTNVDYVVRQRFGAESFEGRSGGTYHWFDIGVNLNGRVF